MDCESDESDRWEDFFGSTTDISNSVFAYYDHLSSSIDDTKSINTFALNKTTVFPDTNTSHDHCSLLDFDQSTNVVSCTTNGNTTATSTNKSVYKLLKTVVVPPPLPKFPPPSIHRRHRNFRALSANVQRLISHSNTSLHPDDMNDSNNHSVDETQFDGVKKRLAAAAVTQTQQQLPTTNGNSKFKHPLSKNTDKLTQFGSDLVIDDSDGGYDGYETPPENPYECKHNSLYDDVNSNVYEDADGESDYVKCDDNGDNDKTPINEFEFDYDQVQADEADHINGNVDDHDVDEDVYDEVEKLPEWNSHENNNKVDGTTAKTPAPANTVATSTPIVTITMDTAPVTASTETSTPILSLKNASFIHSMLSKCEMSAIDSSPGSSAKNSPTLSQKSTESSRGELGAIKCATTMKSQLFSIKAQVIEQNAKQQQSKEQLKSTESKCDTVIMNGKENGDVDDKLNVPLNDVNSTTNRTSNSSSSSSNNSSKSKSKSKENGLLTVDLKRTKIRPLSSVSISSTSSSSSSASDEHSSNQNAISYLASVESLADHSENELAILSSSLTVTERACLEIIDSERSYANDLGQVIKGYLNDWQERGHLESHDLNTLFGNIQEVYDFSVILLNELEQSGTEPMKIAKCFIKLQDEFDAYTQYCTSYPDAISLLTTLLQASHTNALLATTQQSLQHTLPLGSYLLKPVQRILKYHLLLDNLRKHCDVPEVVQAHEIMRNVAQHIDQVKRSLEQQSRVRELSGILDGWLGPELTVLGDLVLEGILTENGKPRTVLLFETMLIITKKKEDNRLQFKTYINCKSLMLIEHLPGDPESFSVIPYNDPHPNQIKLTARNRDQKRRWAQHIKQVMLAHFDIPNRAKELLFKLGEEEDRTTDKNTWRWNTHSSTTPEYLERRNQYRRSETRYRSKKQRKKFNTSLSMVEDQFDHSISNSSTAINTNDTSKSKVLDSMIKELQQRNSLIKSPASDDTISIASSTATYATDMGSKTDDYDDLSNLYEIPFDANKALPSKPASALDKAKSKLLEVRMYNTKTLPKRIANLKKQRSKTLKETSKFYMDLPPEQNQSQGHSQRDTETVLKITETSDDLTLNDVRVNRRRASLDANDAMPKSLLINEDINRKLSSVSLLTPMNLNQKLAMNKNKRDIDIISELLKDHKEFDRILKKPPKKQGETDKQGVAIQPKFMKGESLFRMPLPPIPTEANEESTNTIDTFIQRELPPEPIYESLLRNVHVPYKFPSPILNRSLSQPNNNRLLKVKRPTEAPPKRPDSDYVTLTFDENGEITSIDDDIRLPKHGSHFRKSDTNINYHVRRMPDEKVPSMESFDSSTDTDGLRRSTSIETDYSLSVTDMQSTKLDDLPASEMIQRDAADAHATDDGVEAFKSVDHLNTFNKSMIIGSKLPERRVSDVTGMHRKSIIHKQGSKALGSRIASVDYADPKILFANNMTSATAAATNKPYIKTVSNIQRDSAFSLTSSNDSVNIAPNEEASPKQITPASQQVTVIYTNEIKPEPNEPAVTVCNTTTTTTPTNNKISQPMTHLNRGGSTSSSSSSSSSSNSGDDSYYEKTVESYLENDGIFRDSAIYSDDNVERQYTRPEHIYSTIDEVKQEERVKPSIPPKLHLKKSMAKINVTAPARSAPPPPLPAKPAIVPSLPLPVVKSQLIEKSIEIEKLLSSPLPPLPVPRNPSPSPSPPPPPSLPSSINDDPSPPMPTSPPPKLPTTDEQLFSIVSDVRNFEIASDSETGESIIKQKQRSLEPQQQQQDKINQTPALTPPPVPARNFTNKNSSWVLKQIQNFDK